MAMSPPKGSEKSDQPKNARPDLKALGQRMRAAREAEGIGLRELARRIECSPGLVSQVENGLVTPSVATLYAMTTEIGVPIDELLSGVAVGAADGDGAAAAKPAKRRSGSGAAKSGNGSTKRPATSRGAAAAADTTSFEFVSARGGRHVQLPNEVRWRTLAGTTSDLIELLEITYPPGAMSCEPGEMLSHEGEEHGYVIEGCFTLEIGDQTIALRAGDSIALDAETPHRLSNPTDKVTRGLWIVDTRLGRHSHTHGR